MLVAAVPRVPERPAKRRAARPLVFSSRHRRTSGRALRSARTRPHSAPSARLPEAARHTFPPFCAMARPSFARSRGRAGVAGRSSSCLGRARGVRSAHARNQGCSGGPVTKTQGRRRGLVNPGVAPKSGPATVEAPRCSPRQRAGAVAWTLAVWVLSARFAKWRRRGSRGDSESISTAAGSSRPRTGRRCSATLDNQPCEPHCRASPRAADRADVVAPGCPAWTASRRAVEGEVTIAPPVSSGRDEHVRRRRPSGSPARTITVHWTRLRTNASGELVLGSARADPATLVSRRAPRNARASS
jgi:hypothetical protein